MKELWIKIIKDMIQDNIICKNNNLPPMWKDKDFKNIPMIRICLY